MNKAILALSLVLSAGAAQAQNVPHVTVGIICNSVECVEIEHSQISPSLDACRLVRAQRHAALVHQIIRAGLAGSVVSINVEYRLGVGA